MQPDLPDLKITDLEVEQLSAKSLSDISMVNLYQLPLGFSRKQLLSIMLNQIVVFGLTLIISLPLTLLMITKTSYASDDPRLINLFIKIVLGISLGITLCWNTYMWWKTKPLKELAKLQNEVNKYNQVIMAVEIMDRLAAVGNLEVNLINRNDVIKALGVTRESLICGLQTERILRENQDFIMRRYELFASMENNLSALINFDVKNQATEYGKLLNEALEIGMSVQKEVQNFSRVSARNNIHIK
ncbi:hypothetical protein ACP6PL_20125 [Dapis sp. BLCC M126]|uniref:hypothetical protein n=1 Tax=Dapis sp. BLCC M126 TaxID=3400189 RepID=UPI003CF81341